MLKKKEYLAGWCEFHCPRHGILGVAPSSSDMACGERAQFGRRCNQIATKSYGKWSTDKPPLTVGFALAWVTTIEQIKALQIATSRCKVSASKVTKRKKKVKTRARLSLA